MKVVYCIDSLALSGGTERVTTTKLNWLCHCKDVEVAVVTIQSSREPFFPLDKEVRVISMPTITGGAKEYQARLEKILDVIKPEVTVAVAGYAVATLPKLKDGSKKILEFHYTKNFLVNFVKGLHSIRFRSLHILKMRYLQWKLAQQAKRYDKFVGLTARDVSLWGSPKNMTYVHNPLSFRSAEKSTCLNKRIISVGSWTPAKGMDQLLEAFGPIAKSYPEWEVDLYGSGQDEDLLRAIIAKYDMAAQVHLHAPVKSISEKLVEASIYAFPSRSDGFGLVITEAMECGLPTVAMDCQCGPCEIVTEKTGVVVPDGDITAFRKALQEMMDNEERRVAMGKASAIEVKRFYTDEIMQKWVNLFGELVKTT